MTILSYTNVVRQQEAIMAKTTVVKTDDTNETSNLDNAKDDNMTVDNMSTSQMSTDEKAQAWEDEETRVANELRERKNTKHTRATLLAVHKTKSASVRWLDSQGFTRVQILAMMNDGVSESEKMIYQHVRNILVTIVKKDLTTHRSTYNGEKIVR